MGATDSEAGRELSGLRVLAHPLRLRMLSLLTGAPMSATELAAELGVTQALASYHVRQLHAAGLVDLDEVRERRGGRERRYRYRPAGRPAARTPNGEDRALLAEALAVELRRRIREGDPSATWVGVDAELWVDPADWAAALDAVRTASTALHAQAKPPRAAGSVRVSMTAALFSMVPDESADG